MVRFLRMFSVIGLMAGSGITVAFGQCLSGNCADGYGEKKYPDGGRYAGQFVGGMRACGVYTYQSGNVYKGCFQNNQRTGYSTFSYASGELFTGHYREDRKVFGEYVFSDGSRYTGAFTNDKPDGYGSVVYPDGRRWEGQWEAGKRGWGGFITATADSIQLSREEGSKKSLVSDKASAPRIFAVVVGIADYPGSQNDLQYSDRDARLFYSHLTTALARETGAGKSVLLLNEQATRRNILNALQEVFAQSTENDFIIFYFSGHGLPGNFITPDFFSNHLEHELVKDFFERSKARYRLCIADACFSGSIGYSGEGNASVASTTALQNARLAVIMSSRPTQYSQEVGLLEQGLFTYYLLRGLQGRADLNNDSYVTAGELFLFTKNAVSVISNGQQVPVIFGKNLHLIPLARIR